VKRDRGGAELERTIWGIGTPRTLWALATQLGAVITPPMPAFYSQPSRLVWDDPEVIQIYPLTA
jgi:hypothetical protein